MRMRMRVLTTKLRVEIENETRVFLESLDFEIDMRVSQKSGLNPSHVLDNILLRSKGRKTYLIQIYLFG